MNAQAAALEAALAEPGSALRQLGATKFFDLPAVQAGRARPRGCSARSAPGRAAVQVGQRRAARPRLDACRPEDAAAPRETLGGAQRAHELADEAPAGARSTVRRRAAASAQAAQHEPTVSAVALSTLHSAKGLEWDSVYIVGLSEGLLPISYARGLAAIDEERRLLYVGITRARRRLSLSWSRQGSRGQQPGAQSLSGGAAHEHRGCRRHARALTRSVLGVEAPAGRGDLGGAGRSSRVAGYAARRTRRPRSIARRDERGCGPAPELRGDRRPGRVGIRPGELHAVEARPAPGSTNGPTVTRRVAEDDRQVRDVAAQPDAVIARAPTHPVRDEHGERRVARVGDRASTPVVGQQRARARRRAGPTPVDRDPTPGAGGSPGRSTGSQPVEQSSSASSAVSPPAARHHVEAARARRPLTSAASMRSVRRR